MFNKNLILTKKISLFLLFAMTLSVMPPVLHSSVNVLADEVQAVKPTSNFPTESVIGKTIPIKLSDSSSGTIYFTTDGSDPTTKSYKYSTPITINDSIIKNNTITIKALVDDSSIASFVYTVDNDLVLLNNEASIPAVINEMTLQEKATLLGGSKIKPLAGAAGSTQAIARLNIIGTSLSDGPAGIRITAKPAGFTDSQGNQAVRNATWWANGSARASTWNTSLQNQMGTAWGKEMYFFGNDLLLGPGMNIQRYALNGRNFEYYSEDPLLTGKTGIAEVNGIQSQGVGTTVKHYAANNQENGRSNLPETISTRALREIYLRGFEYVVEGAQPWSIMTSYNQINGVSTAANPELLKSVLRTDFGFKGFAMTDWGGQGNASYWPAQAGNNVHSSLVKAGNDLSMPSGNPTNIIAGLDSKFITMSNVDTSVKKILEYVIKTPAFKGVTVSTEPSPYTSENLEIANNVAVESMTLLKNDTINKKHLVQIKGKDSGVNNKQSLPIKGKNIIAIGTGNDNMVRGGSGSGSTNADTTNSLQLPAALSALGKTVINSTSSTYNFPQVDSVIGATDMFTGISTINKEIQVSDTQMVDLVRGKDAAVMTLRGDSGEGSDIKDIKGAYYLSDAERALINTASVKCRAAGVPFIIVMNMGAPIEMDSWRDKADAILFAWEPGVVLGRPVAEVLTGAANPSGKLSTTFPVNVKGYYNNGTKLLPYSSAEDNFGSTTGTTYDEGIYVGYRYYDKYKVPVSYEFGYGKNYSTFDYKKLKLNSSSFTNSKSILNVTLDVKNTSSVNGKEVTELYVGAPGKSMDKPVKELKGFAKTNVLSKNKKQTLNFNLDAMSLASFDEKRSAWVIEPGNYKVYAAASSKDIRQTAKFNVPREIVVKTVSNVLKPN
ncbi:glycoside hydrolase family 3 C-terminal domain-containing protein [Clostridium algoriphilum]|uniref:glycoside hydrolase family 3 N-terminal domain-containing protein n=1 Tax=Clostridium algoriphilum TaxID=198347 RepID=UPI001CF506EA|nr:glycoside hydrolase family 3 N-terminal domain-containing protein [Clostridium algoriphilum]MCB2294557.1 glycoside hydrolase family 3 C-terminal domain-containing protein [Clostridium algoriphilum]